MGDRWEPGQSTVTDARPTEKAAAPQEQEFAGKAYLPAPGLERLGQELIERHQVLSWLREGQGDQDSKYNILYRWKAFAGKSGGQTVRGWAKRASANEAFFTDATWIIDIAADEARGMNVLSLEALLFHQLCHLVEVEVQNLQGETVRVPRVQGHQFEGFLEEVALYGPWTAPLLKAEQVFGRQLKLDLTGKSTATDEDEDDGDVELDEAMSRARASELVAARSPELPPDARYADAMLDDARELAGARA